ncbi:DUF1403 family protein [Mesorhizobium sp. CAU 1741]|uniref:DUF1403 family protein n=1 Tax=Mesorhizobium sp. CAU 1741 TaxID=3140366 RepID=UPI00325B8B6F
MNADIDSSLASAAPVPRVPPWAVPKAPVENDAEAAYMAGAALGAIDVLVRSDAPWLGAWRHRLALKSAAATVRLLGRRENENTLRDALMLKQGSDDAGPGGNVLAAWRRLARGSATVDTELLATVSEMLGIAWSDELSDLAEIAEASVSSSAPAPLVAAGIANAVVARDPRAEALAWWLADHVLSARMRWPQAVPLLATQIHSPLLRFGGERLRCRPGDDGFERAVCIATAAAAAEACRLGSAIDIQARRLLAVAPKLRSKGAGQVIDLLLRDDAVSGSLTTKTLSRWASRRLFERLIQLDAVRELSGRDTFRLYGL